MIYVKVTEDDLYAAMSELHNTGSVDWVATDGVTIVRLVEVTEDNEE